MWDQTDCRYGSRMPGAPPPTKQLRWDAGLAREASDQAKDLAARGEGESKQDPRSVRFLVKEADSGTCSLEDVVQGWVSQGYDLASGDAKPCEAPAFLQVANPGHTKVGCSVFKGFAGGQRRHRRSSKMQSYVCVFDKPVDLASPLPPGDVASRIPMCPGEAEDYDGSCVLDCYKTCDTAPSPQQEQQERPQSR